MFKKANLVAVFAVSIVVLTFLTSTAVADTLNLLDGLELSGATHFVWEDNSLLMLQGARPKLTFDYVPTVGYTLDVQFTMRDSASPHGPQNGQFGIYLPFGDDLVRLWLCGSGGGGDHYIALGGQSGEVRGAYTHRQIPPAVAFHDFNPHWASINVDENTGINVWIDNEYVLGWAVDQSQPALTINPDYYPGRNAIGFTNWYGEVLFDNVELTEVMLLDLEIVGPNEVAENFHAQYQAVAYYDNNSTADVTDSANCVWSVEPNDNASILAGLLITESIDWPEDIMITASYTEGDNNDVAQKEIQVLTTCSSGSALEFDGTNDYVDIPDSDSLSVGAGDYTICAWIKPESLGDSTLGQAIVFKAKNNSDKEFIFHQNGGKLSLEVEKNSNNRKAETTTLPVTTNIWQHVAVTFESSSLTPAFYHNGQIQPSISNINALPDQLDDPLCIGRWGGTYNNYYFEGIIDEVAIYNRALSGQEVQYLMDSHPDDTDPNLVVYFSFDEGQGQVVNDLSDSNNHGQLGSTPEIDTHDPNWVYSDAMTTICHPPVAEAGPNQVAVEGDSVILDGSGSFDADGDILTFSWRLVSKPSESIAELTDPNSEQTSFIPDVPGEYAVGLVVSDDYFDSEEDEVNITVISLVDAIEETLDETAEEIGNLDPNTFKNSNMTNALTDKIDEVLAMIDAGQYETALAKLENDILKKTDGCANPKISKPDKNDWIKTCEEQGQIYPLVTETIEYVESLME